METAVLREKLHEYIDTADEQHLTAIYVLIKDKIAEAEIFDEATMNMLYKRREDHLSGLSKSYTIEESMEMIRRHKKQNGL